jgi:hypothetical protein
VIVREQDEVLGVVGRGPGIVRKARQGVVGARTVKQHQGPRLIRSSDIGSIRDLVADGRQFGGGKQARQIGGGHIRRAEVEVGVQHIGIRNLLPRPAD